MDAEKKYPECEKLAKVEEKSQAIGEFLSWLSSKKEIELCKERDDGKCSLYVARFDKQALLAEFFAIDMEKVEEERREMLASLQV